MCMASTTWTICHSNLKRLFVVPTFPEMLRAEQASVTWSGGNGLHHFYRTPQCKCRILVPCAGLEFDLKAGLQLAVRVQARPRPAIIFQAQPGQAHKLEFRPRPNPDREFLAQVRPGPQVSGPGPAHTRGTKMGKPAARKPAAC